MEIGVALFTLAAICLLARYAFGALLQADALLVASGLASILGRLSVCLAVATILPDLAAPALARGVPHSVPETMSWLLAWLPPILLLALIAWQLVIVGAFVWIDAFGAKKAARETA